MASFVHSISPTGSATETHHRLSTGSWLRVWFTGSVGLCSCKHFARDWTTTFVLFVVLAHCKETVLWHDLQ
jgi:hypothetical protein